MSDTENRKSMDDVLASIRKIVRAEKDPESVQDAETVPTETTILPPEAAGEAEESAPLALTPDMMMAEETVEAMAAPVAQAPEALDSVQESVGDAMEIDPTAIRDMVREAVMEQLSGPEGDNLIRNVIRDELTKGDTGSNISTNVLKLIQSEIGKAMKG